MTFGMWFGVAFIVIMLAGYAYALSAGFGRWVEEAREEVEREQVESEAWSSLTYVDAQWFAEHGYSEPLRHFDTVRREQEQREDAARRTVTAVFCDPVTGKSVTGTWRLNPDGTEHSFSQSRFQGWSI